MTEVSGLPSKQLAFEMTASRRGLIMSFGKLTEHEGRLNELPLRPREFRPMVGTYAQISAEANRRNEAQTRSGFLDYLYAPEPQGASLEDAEQRTAADELLKSLAFDVEAKGDAA